GKARYIIEDDESTRLGRVAAFAQKLLGLDAAVVIRFAPPMDCFGNLVDESGRSFDSHGRIIDAKSYILGEGDKATRNGVRDAQYTRELGDVICSAFKKNTVVMSTHLVAAVAFERLQRSVGSSEREDIFALLRHKDDVVVPMGEFHDGLAKLVARVKSMAEKGEIVLAPTVENASTETILNEALRAFAGYHSHEVITRRGTNLVLADTRLLFYYQNRLAAHGLGADLIGPGPKPPGGRPAGASTSLPSHA
ncbi:MAG: hypothetical protein ABIP39_10985, partial [Polyangiaceae bacterium]